MQWRPLCLAMALSFAAGGVLALVQPRPGARATEAPFSFDGRFSSSYALKQDIYTPITLKRVVPHHTVQRHELKVERRTPRVRRGAAHRELRRAGVQKKAPAQRQKSGLNIFDVLGAMPDPLGTFLPVAPSPFLAFAGGAITGGVWSVMTTAASTSLREDRELSGEEACTAILSAMVPFGGFLPWGGICKVPVDTCYHPEYVSYPGLRDDDPVGRYGHWVAWMKKYCKDVDWHKYSHVAQEVMAPHVP